ncbi:MAG: DUF1549 domain-containing protein [Verrucomicrobia bacterium]|nr:DUF1549 domain-containing protein [Verrucomicrobiota bacterium]
MNTAKTKTTARLPQWKPVLLLTLAGALAAVAAAKAPYAGRAAQSLDTTFKTLDVNHDGKLDRKEFEKLIQLSPKMKADPDSAERMFGYLDKDQDEKLTLEEFRGIALLQAMAAKKAAENPTTKTAAAKPATMAHAAEKPATAEGLAFFEKKIRPVLTDKCYKCHAADSEKIKGGLVLDTREGIRAGGDTGHAVVPGDLGGSLLIKAIRYADKDLAMPPEKNGGKLSDEIIADFETWVKMGAPDPRDGKALTKRSIDIEKGKEHWAFQVPTRAPAPAVKDASWARGDIDRHILAGLEAKGLKPVGDADKATLLRRVYFDLIGLPPSPEELAAFLNDTDAKAFEKVVDKLLASPQYGERWGRHWLDVARYAESSGKSLNVAYPHAWRYREYVIAAFNADKPYDKFLKEQLAGDLLPAKNDTQKAEQLVATGFLAIGPKEHNTRDYKQFQLDVADEQIDAVTQGMLGLTVACARCHDHKFDPVPQADYYALAGIFLSTETRFGTPRFIQNNNTSPLNTLPENAAVPNATPLSKAERDAMNRQLAQFKKQRDDVLAESRAKGDRAAIANPRLIGASIQIATLEKLLGRYDENGNQLHLAMGAQDKNYPRDTQLLGRGELDKPGATVPRGFVQVVATKRPAKISKGSGRAELADWIASPENPLTARVMANRVWVNLFDHGIVPTPDNFGTTGQMPTNQKLLDSLAIAFVENGWSVKKLVKQIVMSRTYQLASDHSEANYAADPDNHLHWRMSKRRLDAEAIRDSMLAIAGKLDLAPPAERSIVERTEGNVLRLALAGAGGGPFGRPGGMMGGGSSKGINSDYTCRSVYLPIVRDQVPDSLGVFDFAEPSLVTGDREDTTVPSQALYLMNSASVQKLCEAMAARLVGTKATGTELGKKAFELVYSRPPTANELKATGEFFTRFNAAEAQKYSDKDRLGFAGLTAFCQALLGSAEFRYLN